MVEELESAIEPKLQAQSDEEGALLEVVYRALGDDLIRIRRFLETAMVRLASEEASSDRVTVVDPEEVRPTPKP